VIAYLDNMNTTPLKKSKGPACLRAAIITSVGFSMLAPFAQAATWDGGGSDTNWSTTLNWSDDASPAGQAVLFDNTAGLTSGPTVAGNNVDSSLTLDSLSYANTGTSGSVWQVTQISGGQTLTLDSASTPPSTIFSVGGVAAASTRVAILGAGTFTINEATSSIAVGGPTANQSVVLDMSGLAVFNATVATVNFGASRANGDVTLANTNTITATTFNVGNVTSSTGSNSKSDLLLGTTNTINADTINVGVNYASGTIRFQSGLTSPTVTIRGNAGGTSRADITIANTFGVAIGNSQGSSVDFTASGGNVDARIGTLLIGRRGDAGGTTTYTGSLAMNKGSIDATTVVLGQSAGTGVSANSVTADLTVSGGTFNAGTISMADNAAGATSVTANLNVSGTAVVTVAGNVVAGSLGGTATTVAANINVSSGKLVIQGDLAEGTNPSGVTSTVNLSGGTLDMDHGSIAVDTVNFTAGTLKNVASFAAGAGLDVQNASTLAYDVDGAFTSTVLTGTLTLGAGANLELSLATGFVPTGDLLLVANDGSESIVGTFATINGGSFDGGNGFTLTNNTGSYVFTLNYAGGTGNDLVAQLSAVPEPAAYAVLVGGAMMVLVAGRRRRRH
jgi:hypothetical protein